MLTFSINKTNTESGDSYSSRVWNAINANIKYFMKFNPLDWEEAANLAYLKALENRNDRYYDITPYVKKLARTVLRNGGRKEDIVSPVHNDDGEINAPFLSLQETIDISTIDGFDELFNEFKLMYLESTESFMKLQQIFLVDEEDELRASKDVRVRDESIRKRFMSYASKFGADATYACLKYFFDNLDKLTSPRLENQIKLISLKPSRKVMVNRIPDTASIVDKDGRYYYIDRSSLTMERNPDYFEWDVIGTPSNVLRLDMSSYLNFVCEEVYVPEGINTRFVTWCGDFYKLTMPSGDYFINLDRDKFVSRVRVELILALMLNGIPNIVAVSPDYVYFKPTRRFSYNTIRVETVFGKFFDFPVEVHIAKGKRK